MAVRNILRIGNPLLRQKSQDFTEDEVLTRDFKKLLKDMFDTMRHENGVGLAAPQVGVLKKLVVIGSEKNERYPEEDDIEETVIINPIITPLEPPDKGFWEGCLSIPGMRGYVERPKKIKIEYYDQKWTRYSKIFEGFKAIVLQHECDHLDGVLYVDRLKDIKLFGYTDEINTEGKDLD